MSRERKSRHFFFLNYRVVYGHGTLWRSKVRPSQRRKHLCLLWVIANNGLVKANNALIIANNGLVKANNALVIANNVLVKANNALVIANNALVIANNALVMANNAWKALFSQAISPLTNNALLS